MMNFKGYKKLLKDGRAKNIIIAVGILGVLLIFISSFTGLNGGEQETSDYSVSAYRTDLQDSLSEMLTRIEGVGSV
ncbi:MAG: hypothetical protein IJ725_05200, partial [Ruminococcus sp.]|nr:hypothetical protein [Ruminococcus sp.]